MQTDIKQVTIYGGGAGVLLISLMLLVAGCGGGEEQASAPPPQGDQAVNPQPGTLPQEPPAPPPGSTPAPVIPPPQPPASSPPPTTTAPFASAGPDQRVDVGQFVTINGNVQPESLQVCWQILSKPPQSNAFITVSGPRGLTVTITPDEPGPYTIKLGCGPPFFPEIQQLYTDTVVITAIRRQVSFRFTAGGGEQVQGLITYDPTAENVETNVRNLMPNRVFRLQEWHVEVQQIGTAPATVYDSRQPDNAAEFCEGVCLFSATTALRLFFTNATTMTLEVAFADGEGSPPQDINGWGEFRFATYRVPCPVCVPVAVLEVGTIMDVTP